MTAAISTGGLPALRLPRTTAPSIDDQQAFYVEVLRAFPDHRVVFRTMDIGADEPLPFVEREGEDNPALGLRGIDSAWCSGTC